MNPHLVVALGATAVLALAGKALPISRNRGATHFGERLGFITVHPSFLLRLPQEKDRTQAYDAFVADLRQIRKLASARNPPFAEWCRSGERGCEKAASPMVISPHRATPAADYTGLQTGPRKKQ
ncbi:hypothetical protein GGC47_005411 [Bosea sp. OAE752]